MSRQQQQAMQQQVIAQAVTQTATAMEKKLDAEIAALDNMDEDDFEMLRRKRLQKLKEKSERAHEWRRKGHGSYHEVGDQKQWFEEVKTNERLVCHFYRPTTWRCEIVDKHMEKLAHKHIETRFIKVDAEKCPFLAERLNIVLMPTIIMTKDTATADRIEGFDDLGGTDKFTTEDLERRLARCGVIDFEGPLDVKANKADFTLHNKGNKKGTAVYQSNKTTYESDSDFSD